MTVRPATADDVPRIVELGVSFVAESEYWRLGTANPDKIAVLALSLIESGAMFVAERDGRVVGMLGGCVVDHPMVDALIASELAWYVEPGQRGSAGAGLLSAFTAWAVERGASVLHMVAPTDRVAEHYRRLGYTAMESSFMRRIG